MLAALTARDPTVPITFGETGPLAELWTHRFLGAALLTHHFDCIVIGSGFGGFVTTCRLAEVGRQVLLPEPGGVAVAISGVGAADSTRRVKFADHVVPAGEVLCTDVAQLTIQHNE